MTGFEPQISGVESNRSTNCAPSTSNVSLNGQSPASFSHDTILQEINVQIINLVSGAGF